MRAARRAAVGVVAVVAAYALVLVYPQPLFAYELEHAGIVVHSIRPIPEAMKTTLERARQRLERSPLLADTYGVHVFMCPPTWLFALFARQNYRAGGIANVYIGQHVFLRAADMEHDRLMSPSGRPVPADRPLSYFVAHEIMHVAHGRVVGRWRYFHVPQWLDDGDADLVGRDFDFNAALRGYQAGARDLDPLRSGLYVRYALMVAFAVDKLHQPIAALLAHPPDREPIERALAALAAW